MEIEKPHVLIEEWAVSRRKNRQNPEQFVSVLVGIAPTHPKFLKMSEQERTENPILFSSRLVFFNFEKRIAETRHTVYELGSIDEFWARCLEEEGTLISSFDFDYR